MSKSNAFENQILSHIFLNTDIANIGDAAGLQNSVAAGNLYVALHTADPGEAGDQTTSEANYVGYARAAVARVTGWQVTGNLAENVAAVQFPICTGGSSNVTHFSVGKLSGGASDILYSGVLGAPLAVTNNILPEFPAGAIDVTED